MADDMPGSGSNSAAVTAAAAAAAVVSAVEAAAATHEPKKEQGSAGERHNGRIVAVDVKSCGAPSGLTWLQGLALLQPEEQTRVQRFHFDADKSRALSGRLLLRFAIAEDLGHRPRTIVLERTKAGKPFLARASGQAVERDPARTDDAYSFNVSHHGNWVILGAAHTKAIGIDITRHEQPRGCKTVEEYFSLMQRCFTDKEWNLIRNPPPAPSTSRTVQKIDAAARTATSPIASASNVHGAPQYPGTPVPCEHEQLRQFYRHWALKESYVKATGEGIVIDLTRIEFSYASREQLDGAQAATVVVDGIPRPEWAFTVFHVDREHYAAVCERRRKVVRKQTEVWLPAGLQSRLIRHGHEKETAASAAEHEIEKETVPEASHDHVADTVPALPTSPRTQRERSAERTAGSEAACGANKVVEVLPFAHLVRRLNDLNRPR